MGARHPRTRSPMRVARPSRPASRPSTASGRPATSPTGRGFPFRVAPAAPARMVGAIPAGRGRGSSRRSVAERITSGSGSAIPRAGRAGGPGGAADGEARIPRDPVGGAPGIGCAPAGGGRSGARIAAGATGVQRRGR
ncbi:hypothetical protein CSPHI_04060 [Corynebacterium sphenisci DSM 44792]|uniref:Uncharacterized protein n=1 Tax=Corynebacterium sphenisci DSM 44792 TaxID=1437874 RepID=A0A1L7CWV8_9CORY|nr:hypothetical protein CSPHI_04060 [Corynebacterium sphenisci DSM 44792]